MVLQPISRLQAKQRRRKKKSINKTSVTVKSVVYDGNAKKPKPVVKDGSKTLTEGTDYKITGYKNNINVGTATITIQGIGKYTESKTSTFKITEKATTKNTSKSSSKYSTKKSTSRYRTSARTYRTYRTYTPRTTRPGITSSTGTTVPNVTYAPDRTITVKEVFLGQQIMDEPQEEPTPADMMEEGWDDMSEDESNEWDDAEDITLDFGPMAGSAAVAVGACGAGVVGRIRKFKLDTATKAVEQVTNTKGKK